MNINGTSVAVGGAIAFGLGWLWYQDRKNTFQAAQNQMVQRVIDTVPVVTNTGKVYTVAPEPVLYRPQSGIGGNVAAIDPYFINYAALNTPVMLKDAQNRFVVVFNRLQKIADKGVRQASARTVLPQLEEYFKTLKDADRQLSIGTLERIREMAGITNLQGIRRDQQRPAATTGNGSRLSGIRR